MADKDNPIVDPTSADFDPLLALYSEESAIDPDVKPFDNIAQFESHMKRATSSNSANTSKMGSGGKKSKSFSQRRKIHDEVQNRDVSKLEEFMKIRKQMDMGEHIIENEEIPRPIFKKNFKKNAFTSMENLSAGPMSLLFKAVEEQIRSNVYVRDFCGLRGVCRGFIVAFDRFMNLSMIDVDETFRKPPLGKVKNHQKAITVSTLSAAFEQISLKGLEQNKYKNVFPSNKNVQEYNKETSYRSKPNHPVKLCVKRIERGKYFAMEKFSGGYPVLYHRHIPQLLIKGDNVVLISLDTL